MDPSDDSRPPADAGPSVLGSGTRPDPSDPTHHPGPPLATSVGESVELAPRGLDAVVEVGPDGAATDADGAGLFAWSLAERPDGSAATLGDGAVVRLAPDVPGTYRATLEAPDGTHEQRVRVLPDERVETSLRAAVASFDAPAADVRPARVSVAGGFNDWTVGRDRPRPDGDHLRYDLELPPGRHRYAFAPGDSLAAGAGGEHVVPGPGRPRLRLDARVDGDAVVVTADAEAAPAGPDRAETPAGAEPDVEWLLDGRDGLSRTDVTVETPADDAAATGPGTAGGDVDGTGDSGHALRVPLAAIPAEGIARVHAVPVAERYGVRDTVELWLDDGDRRGVARAGAEHGDAAGGSAAGAGVDGAGSGGATGAPVRAARPTAPPAWARSPTVYEVFVRAFAGETPDTTFREIERRLPYVASLGVDVLWLTPVLESHTRHGYHVTDYARTASDLGTRAEFESLVDACHDRGIRVVFDLVINHTSRDHPAFQGHAAGVDAYADHYARRPGRENPSDVDWAGDGAPRFRFEWERIPDLNYASPTVRAWMCAVVDEWAAAVDGFRCDIAWGVPHGFWLEVADRLRGSEPGFLLLDETIPRDPFAGEAFHAHYDTALAEALRDVGAGERDADAILDAVDDAAVRGFAHDAVHLRYVENHDEPRYLAEHGAAALRAAAAATFLLPGAPMVYAGQERGMTEYRADLAWHDGDTALTDYHRRLARARREHRALRDGDVARLPADAVGVDPASVTAFVRGTGGDRVAVVLNFAAGPVTVTLGAAVEPTDLLSGDDVGAPEGSGADATGDGDADDADGSDGADGADGADGVDGADGADGATDTVVVESAVVCRLV